MSGSVFGKFVPHKGSQRHWSASFIHSGRSSVSKHSLITETLASAAQTLQILRGRIQQQPLIIHCPLPFVEPHAHVGNLCTKSTLAFTHVCVKFYLYCGTFCWSCAHFVFWRFRQRCRRLLSASWQLCHRPQRRNHHAAGPLPRYVPRRAVLYCPGNDERKLRKLASLDVDCAVLDCEDGVALSKKVEKVLALSRRGKLGPGVNC